MKVKALIRCPEQGTLEGIYEIGFLDKKNAKYFLRPVSNNQAN